MHAERYVLPAETAAAVRAARARGGRIVAVGTTATRALESALDDAGRAQVLADLEAVGKQIAGKGAELYFDLVELRGADEPEAREEQDLYPE